MPTLKHRIVNIHFQKAEKEILQEAYEKSIELLLSNNTRHGILASRENPSNNYHSVWGRDGSICAAAAFLTENEELHEAGINTLLSLADHQGSNGQIPSYLRIASDHTIANVVYGGLGNVTNVDSNLWFLIACQTAFFQCDCKQFINDRLMNVYYATLRHLHSIDTDMCGFLEIPVGGDWTDILDWSYHVLYDQVLWFRALKGAAYLCRSKSDRGTCDKLEETAQRIKRRLNGEFWWDRKTIQQTAEHYYIHDPLPEDQDFLFYQSHIKPFFNTWYHRFDAFGNVLAALMGIAPRDRIHIVIQRVLDQKLHYPYPLRVLEPPVQPGDDDWNKIYETYEPPYQHHNGGIWPMAGGFWTALLAAQKQQREAEESLLNLAQALRMGNQQDRQWEFFEYFHGQTGNPMGRRYQSWNAAGYIFAYQAVCHGIFASFMEPNA